MITFKSFLEFFKKKKNLNYLVFFLIFSISVSLVITASKINFRIEDEEKNIKFNNPKIELKDYFIDFKEDINNRTYQLQNFKILVLIGLIVWLSFLFSFVGLVSSDFFCPNLSTISIRLGLSESLAGVTLLGFGNGAPDVFSTFAAMNANTGSLAIGELLGAASFIVSVIVGSMAIVRPFKVPRHSFLRDLIFFIIAITFVLITISDGKIKRWEANTLISLYLIYVLSVLISNWSIQKKLKSKQLILKVRNEYSQENQPLEPYLDDPDFPIQPDSNVENSRSSLDHDQPNPLPSFDSETRPQLSPTQIIPSPNFHQSFPTIQNSNEPFKNLLETNFYFPSSGLNRRMRAPSVSFHPSLITLPNPTRPRSISSQDSNVIDYLRRPPRHSIALNSIRPSLLGAIEFRDVVNSLTRESSYNPNRISADSTPSASRSPSQARRQRSGSLGITLRRSSHIPNFNHSNSLSNPSTDFQRFRRQSEFSIPNINPKPFNRIRQIGHSKHHSNNPPFSSAIWDSERLDDNQLEVSTSPSSQLGLEINQTNHNQNQQEEFHNKLDSNQSRSNNLPNKSSSAQQELPSIVVITDTNEVCDLTHSDQDWAQVPENIQINESNKPHWGKLLKIVWETLFPSLKDWRMKSHVGRFVALISAPAVLLLTLTLPVVDDETGIKNEFIDEIVQEEEEADEGLMRSESLRYEEDQVRIDEVEENESEPSLVGDDSRAHDSNFQMGRLSPRGTPIQDLSDEGVLPSMIEINNDELIDSMEGLEVGSEDEEYVSRSTIARWLASLQCILAPSFCLICLIDLDAIKGEKFVIGGKIKLPALMVYLIGTILMGMCFGMMVFKQLKNSYDNNGRFKLLLCFVGFFISMVWILNLVNEVVGVLKHLGEILKISDAILGLTIFGIGNSLGDFIANVTIARMGFPVMAISACFGGPMLNILIGIGLSSSYLISYNDHDKMIHEAPTDSMMMTRRVIELNSITNLMVSGVGLLIVLISILIIVPLKGYLFDRKLGSFLIFEYLIVLGVNCLVEIFLN